MPPIFSLTKEQLEGEILKIPAEKFRAEQVLNWIYKKKIAKFSAMTDIPRKLYPELQNRFSIFTTSIKKVFKSRDGTKKYLIQLKDKNLIETIMIPEKQRVTVCVSTQVGCPIRCSFCASGVNGLKRNLRAEEIVEQVMHIHYNLDKRITDIVLMGIGEPLLNIKNVSHALKIVRAHWGLHIGYNNITLSTIGLVDRLDFLLKEGVIPNIAISLHTPDEEVRGRLVPYLRGAKIDKIIQKGLEYRALARKEVTFEYVLIYGVNDSPQTAQKLARKLAGKKCKINIIPYNHVDGISYKSPPVEVVDRFAGILGDAGVFVTVRKKRGDDISAACGQLRARYAAF